MNTGKITLSQDLLIPKEVSPQGKDMTFPAGAELTKLSDGAVVARVVLEGFGIAMNMTYSNKKFAEKIWNIARFHNPDTN